MMKISIGSKIIKGPFGGGNDFLKNLIQYFENNNHIVVNNLKDDDIDIILLTNPLIDSETATFNSFDIEFYLRFKNSQAIVFQRINECDERKGTDFINKKINSFNRSVDINIFVSDWLRKVYQPFEIYNKEYIVIRGGPSEKIFNTRNKQYWNGNEPLKLVTHHWSNNFMKGYEIYRTIDTLLESQNMQEEIEFSFIGNLPEQFVLPNSTVVKPLYGKTLSEELKKHHIYITGSLNEPSGNHHMEGAMCGLPVMYINSGALPEYCKDFGTVFEKETILESLENLKARYEEVTLKLENYPYTFSYTASLYEKAFINALSDKSKLIDKRKKLTKKIVLINFFSNKVLLFLYSIKLKTKKMLGNLKNYLHSKL